MPHGRFRPSGLEPNDGRRPRPAKSPGTNTEKALQTGSSRDLSHAGCLSRRSADFPVCRSADFPVGRLLGRPCAQAGWKPATQQAGNLPDSGAGFFAPSEWEIPGPGADFGRVLQLDAEGGTSDAPLAARGRTGFDLEDAPEAACRGRFVGLVKNRTKHQLLTKSWLSRPKLRDVRRRIPAKPEERHSRHDRTRRLRADGRDYFMRARLGESSRIAIARQKTLVRLSM